MARTMVAGSLAVISISISIICCEALARAFNLGPQIHRLNYQSEDSAFIQSDNLVLGYEMKRSFVPTGPFSDYTFQTNSWGQRDRERTLRAQEDVFRILVLGDSVVMGLGLADEDKLMPRRLEVELGPRFEALNFGVTGYAPTAEVELMATKGVRFNPDLVIWILTENDLERANKPIAFLPPESAPYRWLLSRSQLFRFILDASGQLGAGSEMNAQRRIDAANEATSGIPLETSFDRMKALSAQYDFAVLTAAWPRFEPTGIVYTLDVRSPMSGKNRFLELSEERGFYQLSLEEEFLGDWNRMQAGKSGNPTIHTPQSFYTIDTMHANRRGTGVAAEILARWVQRRAIEIRNRSQRMESTVDHH